MRHRFVRFTIVLFCLAAFGTAQHAAAQDAEQQESLGDIARRERARKDAERATKPPELGAQPSLAAENEIVPAHFLVVNGGTGDGDFLVFMNGQPVVRNLRIPGLPAYVTPLLRDGANVLGIEFTSSADEPLDITVEQRLPNEKDHGVLAHFHANANEFPNPTKRQLNFQAYPRLQAPVQLTDADRAAIMKLVRVFYDTLARKDGPGLLALFSPALEDARSVFPEGADHGAKALNDLAVFAVNPAIEMEPFEPSGIEIVPNRRVVSVRRSNGTPVFTSNQVSMGASEGASRVSADVILTKKINGQWRLTLPFGF